MRQGKATGARASRGPRTPQTHTQGCKAAPPPPRPNSEQELLEVHVQDSLPEVLGQAAQGPTTDRVEPRPKQGEAPGSSRLQTRVAPTPFRKKPSTTEAVGSTHRAEEPPRHATQMVRLNVPRQTRPRNSPSIARNADTSAATSGTPYTDLDHKVGPKPGEAAKPTGRRSVRKQ